MLRRTKNIDGGWAWVILACGFGCFTLSGTFFYSMGIILEAMLEVFDDDLTLTYTVGSAIIAAQCCAGPLAGTLSKKFGCRACTILGGIIIVIGLTGCSFSRNLYEVLIFGVITGIGYGFPYTTGGIMVGIYFHRLRSLATGIAVAGGGFGMFAGPVLVRYLIDQYGLHGTFLIMAGVGSHFCVIGSLMRPLPRPNHVNRSHRGRIGHIMSQCRTFCNRKKGCDMSTLNIFKNGAFVIYLCSVLLWNIGESACLLHLPNYCIQQGSSKMDTAFLFTAMGIGNIVSRLFTGFAANDERVNTITLFAGQMGVASIFTGLFPLYSRTYGGQMAYSTGIGVYTNGPISMYVPIVVQLVGLDHLPICLGLVHLFAGIGYLTGPPIAGSVYLLSSMSAMLIPLVHSEKDDHGFPGINSIQDITIPLEGTAGVNNDSIGQRDVSDCQLDKVNTIEYELEPLNDFTE